MTSIRSALAFSLIERYALLVLGLCSYVLIARMLTPEEIGIYSVTAALVGVAQVIREFGISSYLIQVEKPHQRELDTALGLALAAGVAMFGVGVLASPWAAAFYRDPRIATILIIISLNFLILPFCSIGQSLLRREMRFRPLMILNMRAGVVGFVVTIGLALEGFGPASLAWGSVATNLVTAGGAWLALSGLNRPRGLAFSEWRPIVRYGRQSTVAAIFTTAASDINDLGVGRILGFAPVAMLSRAMGLINLFQRDLMGAVRNVAYPAYAAAHREGRSLEPMFVYSAGAVCALAWPFYGFLALFPLESLRLLAGPQWDAAAPLVIMFAVAGSFGSTCVLVSTLIMAVGRVDIASRADIIVHAIRLVLVLSATVLLRDLTAVALSFMVSYILAAPIFFWFKQQCVASDWLHLRSHCLRSLAVTGVTLILPTVVALFRGFEQGRVLSLPAYCILGLVCLPIWFFAVHLCRHPLADEAIYQRILDKALLRRVK